MALKRYPHQLFLLSLLLIACSKSDSAEKRKSTETKTTEQTTATGPTTEENSAPKNQVAFTELNLIDGVSENLRSNQTVVIDTLTGKIISVFESNSQSLNAGVSVQNMKGKTMMPGLIEGHFHLSSTVGAETSYGTTSLKNMFRQGITSVRDMAGNGIALKQLQDRAIPKNIPQPKVHFASLITGVDFITNDRRVAETVGTSEAGAVPWFRALHANTDVESLVKEAKAFGCSGLKLYADITSSDALRIIAEAKKIDFPVWAHGTLFPGSPWDIKGVHSFSHAPFLNFVTTEQVPTMQETFTEGYEETYDIATINNPKMLEYFSLMVQNNMILDATLAYFHTNYEAGDKLLEFSNAVMKKAYQQGVKIGAGSDEQNDAVKENDYLLLQEIKTLYKQTGMSRIEALQTATLHNAFALGIEAQYGSIEKGKQADLIILNNDPSLDLDHLKSVAIVIKDGFIHTIN